MLGNRLPGEPAALVSPIDRHRCALVVCAAVHPETGGPLFSWQDIPVLVTKSADAIDRIVWIAMRLNKLTEEDIKELEKN